MKCVLHHKNFKTYLKYFKKLRLKHYVLDINEATVFTKTEAKRMLEKFKHPENWEIIQINKMED